MRRIFLPLLFAVVPVATIVARVAAQPAPLPEPPPSSSASVDSAPIPPALPPPPTTTPPPPPPPAPPPPTSDGGGVPPELAAVMPKKEDEKSDHDQVVGHFGIAYYGQFDVPIGFTGARRAGDSLPVQMVGIRYWWSQRIRVDFALGIDVEKGSQDVSVSGTTGASTSVDQPSTLGLAFRVGLPVSLYSGKHYTIYIGPEFAYGHSGETIPGTPQPTGAGGTFTPPDTTHNGNRTSFGARAGAEIQFGFLGIPQLALDATIGLLATLTNGNTSGPVATGAPPGPTTPTADETFHHFAVQSTVGHQPWNIFITNVAAAYYF